MKLNLRDRRVVIFGVLGIICIILAIIVAVMGFGKNSAPAHSGFTTTPSYSAASMSSPTSAAQYADWLNCGQFHESDMSQPHISLVTDAGICWINGVKYGIDIFSTQQARDDWIHASVFLGTNPPKWETARSVAYKASDQTHDNN